MFDKINTTIFSIDMNNGFAKKGSLYSDRVNALIEPTSKFFLKAKENQIKIIGITDTHFENCLEFLSYPPHCLLGTWESEIVDELKPFMDEILIKNSTNAFFSVPINYVENHNYIITGCCTDICIYQFATTLKAYLNENQINANVIVPISLVDTFDSEGHEADFVNNFFLNSLVSNGITVVSEIRLF